MDVRYCNESRLLPHADPLNLERIQERRRYDHQVPNSFQSHTSSRHHRRAGGDYYWSLGIGRSVAVVHYVRDRSFVVATGLIQNKCALKTRAFLYVLRGILYSSEVYLFPLCAYWEAPCAAFNSSLLICAMFPGLSNARNFFSFHP